MPRLNDEWPLSDFVFLHSIEAFDRRPTRVVDGEAEDKNMKWLGVGLMSIVMGVSLAAVVHTIAPLPSSAFIVVALLGSALMAYSLGRVAHAAGSIEVHHHHSRAAD